MENAQAPSTGQDTGKTTAILSYMTFIGWIVAFILHQRHKTRLGAYHLRQMLGLMLLIILLMILGFPLARVPYGWLFGDLLNLALLILWIFGLVAAVNGDEKPVPLVGDLFQKWFAGFGL